MSRNDECVQVIVRCRPLFGKELAEEKKKTGALENIGQDIGQAFKGWWG